MYENFSRTAVETVSAGDICAVCGIGDIMVSIFNYIVMMRKFVLMLILALSSGSFTGNYALPLRTSKSLFQYFVQIGETIADKSAGKPLPAIKVEEPTVKMAFSINTAPFVGREVCLTNFKGEPPI